MQWYQDYDFILKIFEQGWQVDETSFHFLSTPEIDHFIGYLPEMDKEKPYWVGLCDIPDGTEFKTAKEMFEAKIFDGKSMKERWSELVLDNIGGFSVDDMDKSRFEDEHDLSEIIRSSPQPINKG
ncbi:MAG: hypothetical protein IJ566_01050 [Cardiobacteriaceae bacterium]|nr:hypothetical protein [Cardiobacteriaceae bacterium]